MRNTPVSPPLTADRVAVTPSVAVFLLAVHAPALALGGNRFALILPTAVVLLGLLLRRAADMAPPTYASWLWLAVMGWGGAQIALGLTPDSGEAAQILCRFALYAAIFLLAADFARTPQLGGVLVNATAAWIALICAYGLIAWATGANPILAELEAYPNPLEATFVNRNAFALYALFGLLASLCALALQWRRSGLAGGVWLWAGAALICAAALVLTGSRGGLGAGVISVIAFVVFRSGARAPALLLLAALIGAALLGDAYLRDVPVADDARFAVHGQILAETAKAPFAGHGLGAFQDMFRATLGADWRWGDWDHAHQQYLETAYEIGWPAALSLFAAIALAAPRPARGDPITALALAALAAAAAQALVDFSLTIPSVAMTLALLLGVASGRRRRAR